MFYLYLYTAVVWGGDQGAVHYAFYVSTKSGWGWSVRRENLGVGLWPTGRLTNVRRGAYVTTLLLSTETDGCIVQHIHWGPEGRRPKAVHVGAKPPIHAGAGFSADRRRVLVFRPEGRGLVLWVLGAGFPGCGNYFQTSSKLGFEPASASSQTGFGTLGRTLNACDYRR